MWSVDLPVTITLGKKKPKPHSLNLNWYRNAHFHVLNNVKVKFTDQIKPKVRHLPKMACLSLKYILYPGSHKLCDTANVCSIVDKFFCDTLVEAGVLEDDNYTILGDVRFVFGAVDPKNPRATVEITPIELKESDNMKINLDESEIKQAVQEYVQSQVEVKPGQYIDISFTAGRGEKGMSATVDITSQPKVKDAEPAAAQEVEPVKDTQAKSKPTVERVNGKVVKSASAEDAQEAPQEANTDTTGAMAQGDHVAAASEAEAASPGLFSNL